MDIDKITKLHELGFNVPVHVLDSWYKYKGETLSSLRSYVFSAIQSVTLLAEKGRLKKEFVNLPLIDAVFILSALSKKGYRTLIMEQPEVEFAGRVCWDREEGRGRIWLGEEELIFAFPENLESAKHRHIVRTCQEVVEALDEDAVQVDFWWTHKFLGVNSVKLMIYNYEILKFSLDKSL